MPDCDAHHLGPLLDRSRAGEAEARDALLARLRPYLKALIRSWLGADLARQLADSDVVQVTLVKIHEHFEQFRGQGVPELLGWARRIAYHAAIDHKKQRSAGQAEEGLLQAVPARDLPPLERIERAEEVVRLTAALERLPEARQEVVRARLFEGLSYGDISRRCGTSAGALRILFKRALEQLRQILETEA